MENLAFRPEWYDAHGRLLQQRPACPVLYRANGAATAAVYPVFTGIHLIFFDFHCSHVLQEPLFPRPFFQIQHYQQPQVELEVNDRRVFYLRPEQCCVHSREKLPAHCYFPSGRGSGLTLSINPESATENTWRQLATFEIDLDALNKRLELERQWYVCRLSPAVQTILDGLYAAKGSDDICYFRIKALELLHYMSKLGRNDRAVTPYYSRGHVDAVKRIRQAMLRDLSCKTPLETLLQNEKISMVTFQAIFKEIYGFSPYAYLKQYKMKRAAIRLKEENESISRIAADLGYHNASKFARAFFDVHGVLPREYRKQAKGG